MRSERSPDCQTERETCETDRRQRQHPHLSHLSIMSPSLYGDKWKTIRNGPALLRGIMLLVFGLCSLVFDWASSFVLCRIPIRTKNKGQRTKTKRSSIAFQNRSPIVLSEVKLKLLLDLNHASALLNRPPIVGSP